MSLSNEIIFYKSKDGRATSYIIPVKLLSNNLFKSWRYNRPVDKARVHEIRNFLLDNKPDKIDGEIFAAEVKTEWDKGKQVYEIYDGNHRREAIISGFSDICPTTKIILTITKVNDDNELLELFRRINKMIPLSEADLNGSPNIQALLHSIAKEYCDKYPMLNKTQANPNRPCFNRDTFVSQLFQIYNECCLESGTELRKLLTKVNEYIGSAFSSLLNPDKRNKMVNGLIITRPMYMTAHEAGCYLFLQKNVAIDTIEFYHRQK